jgi:hypothetical protein
MKFLRSIFSRFVATRQEPTVERDTELEPDWEYLDHLEATKDEPKLVWRGDWSSDAGIELQALVREAPDGFYSSVFVAEVNCEYETHFSGPHKTMQIAIDEAVRAEIRRLHVWQEMLLEREEAEIAAFERKLAKKT